MSLGSEGGRGGGSIKLPDHNLPSDYEDVQPKTYDADYISDISSKMQVPDRIAVSSGLGSQDNGLIENGPRFAGMSVPDKIVLAGDNQHIGMRQDLQLDLASGSQPSSDSLSFVGLITPPRTLTLDETFPVVEDKDLRPEGAEFGAQGEIGLKPRTLAATAVNGHIGVPVPYDPGVNLQDSVLLNEEDEATLLRTQVAKLTRRVQVIEQDNQSRFHRELVMYPLILGYFFWKLLGFFARDR